MTPKQKAAKKLQRALAASKKHKANCAVCGDTAGNPEIVTRCVEGTVLVNTVFFAHGLVTGERRFERRIQ